MSLIDGYDPSAVEAVQLEDGSTAYIHHPSGLQAESTILTVQAGGALEELTADDQVDADTIACLQSYSAKVPSNTRLPPVSETFVLPKDCGRDHESGHGQESLSWTLRTLLQRSWKTVHSNISIIIVNNLFFFI